jgi:hypothetical protein
MGCQTISVVLHSAAPYAAPVLCFSGVLADARSEGDRGDRAR